MIPSDGDTLILGVEVGTEGTEGTEGFGEGLEIVVDRDVNALRLGLREKLLRDEDDELRGMISIVYIFFFLYRNQKP